MPTVNTTSGATTYSTENQSDLYTTEDSSDTYVSGLLLYAAPQFTFDITFIPRVFSISPQVYE